MGTIEIISWVIAVFFLGICAGTLFERSIPNNNLVYRYKDEQIKKIKELQKPIHEEYLKYFRLAEKRTLTESEIDKAFYLAWMLHNTYVMLFTIYGEHKEASEIEPNLAFYAMLEKHRNINARMASLQPTDSVEYDN